MLCHDGAEMEIATCGLNYLSHTRPGIALLSLLGLYPDLGTIQASLILEVKENIDTLQKHGIWYL